MVANLWLSTHGRKLPIYRSPTTGVGVSVTSLQASFLYCAPRDSDFVATMLPAVLANGLTRDCDFSPTPLDSIGHPPIQRTIVGSHVAFHSGAPTWGPNVETVHAALHSLIRHLSAS
jgi:hypothetical protein